MNDGSVMSLRLFNTQPTSSSLNIKRTTNITNIAMNFHKYAKLTISTVVWYELACKFSEIFNAIKWRERERERQNKCGRLFASYY